MVLRFVRPVPLICLWLFERQVGRVEYRITSPRLVRHDLYFMLGLDLTG